MTSTTGAARPPRADARRNRDRILHVAEQHFSEHGVTGSLDQLAKSAGIGPGTLYRHFPNRAALLAALLAEREEHLTRELDDIAASSSDAATSLQRWLTALVEWASAFDGLPDPLRDAVSEEASPLALTCQGYITTTDTFLAAAQREGSARPDTRGRDLFLATLAIAWVGSAAMADESSRPGIGDLIRTGWATR
ncbi:TetR/AcrR family transcriptional regulator [Cellulomonas sp. 179-A 9B4 NHS]|uniref:TetR/AcrR family transcriptional regulator n=1 Tax=Cellulomonas sp. 179-A 9B4 NHS TaxID=3142379 RepID=UPI0039A0295E